MRSTKTLYIILVAVLLTACGGGGGGGSSTRISLDTDRLDFVVEYGHGNAEKIVEVSYVGDGVIVGTPPGVSLPSWLNASVSGSETANPLRIAVTVTPGVTGYPGTPGNYEGKLRFVTGRVDGSGVKAVDIPVNFRLYDGILDGLAASESLDTVKLNAYAGTSRNSVSGNVSIGGANGSYAVTSDQAWLTSGTSTGNTPAMVGYTADTSSLAVGQHSATLTITDQDNGDTLNVPIVVRVQPSKILVNDKGISLVSMPNTNRLSATVDIRDNANAQIPITATSDTNWLTVSLDQSSTPAILTLTGDPSMLAEGIHTASISVTPTNMGSSTQGENIRVGFYVSSTDPDPATSVTTTDGVWYSTMDTIRPYYYANYGFDAAAMVIEIYNAYTSELVDSIDMSGELSDIGAMIVSPDGNTLFVSEPGSGNVYSINLNTLTSNGLFASNVGYVDFMAHTRINGIDLLLLKGGNILNMETGDKLATFDFESHIAAGIENNRILLRKFGFNKVSRLAELDVTETPELNVTVTEFGSQSLSGFNNTNCDLEANSAGNEYYSVCGNARVLRYDDTDWDFQELIHVFEDQRTAPDATNVEVLPDGRLLVGLSDSQLMILDLSGTVISRTPFEVAAEVSAETLWRQSLRVTPDGLRFVAAHWIGTSYNLSFTSLP